MNNSITHQAFKSMFNSFIKTFDLIKKIQNQTIFRNKKKQLQGYYRRLQVQPKISLFYRDSNSTIINIKQDINQNQQIGKTKQEYRAYRYQNIPKYYYYQNLVQKLYHNIKFNPQISFNSNLRENFNPYIRRMQNFNSNQSRKNKLNMKQFLQQQP